LEDNEFATPMDGIGVARLVLTRYFFWQRKECGIHSKAVYMVGMFNPSKVSDPNVEVDHAFLQVYHIRSLKLFQYIVHGSDEF
jgi:hypothetical protein